MSADGRWRRATAVAVALQALLTALLLQRPANQKSGHLVGETPADGARLSAVPPSVDLTFSSAVDPVQTHLTVLDASGRSSFGPLRVDGGSVRVPVRVAGNGTYQVGYHVVLRDGQEVSGATAFTVGEGVASGAGTPVSIPHDHLGSGPATVAVLAVGGLMTVLVLPLLFRRRVR